MEKKGNDLILALLMGMLVPCLMLNTAGLLAGINTVPEQTIPSVKEEPTGTTGSSTLWISVLTGDGTVTRMELEDYLVGVVLGEMPASFEVEALKAQAVVARTYTLRRCTVSAKHEGNAVCASPECCQAYCAPSDYLDHGGTQISVDKVKMAVESTHGLVLTYEGELIEAVYFSSSGGRTEDALAVWGSDLPYLRATDSPEAQDAESVTMSTEAFQQALGATLQGRCETWIGAVTYTNGGGVETIEIGGISYGGTELRSLLGLRSTAFIITAVGDSVTITTRGFGHRVGMSQYGAEAMAVAGSTFEEILAHYYQGTVLEEYIDNTGVFG